MWAKNTQKYGMPLFLFSQIYSRLERSSFSPRTVNFFLFLLFTIYQKLERSIFQIDKLKCKLSIKEKSIEKLA